MGKQKTMISMAEQLSFELPVKAASGRDAFFISDANRTAVSMLENSAQWPQKKMILLGPKKCGKTHLLKIWIKENEALKIDPLNDFDQPSDGASVVVDNIQDMAGISAAETRMFHLHNHLHSTGGFLLMASNMLISQSGFQLADLLSRLQGISCTTVQRPDDKLLRAVLLKAFMDRQLSPPPTVFDYILKNISRSFAAAFDIVKQLDAKSLAENRPISRGMATNILHNSISHDY